MGDWDGTDERLIRSALSSAAYGKWESGRADEIVDSDARAFFGVTVATADGDRRSRATAMERAFANADSSGVVSAAALSGLAEFLTGRFPRVAGL